MLDARLAKKTTPDHRTVVAISERVTCGGDNLLVIAGPCSVESAQQIEQVAAHLAQLSVQVLRGGIYKPRTSPYAFQGLGKDGLKILCEAGRRYQMPVVTEVLSPEQVMPVARQAGMIQIGSRNMQNFELLKAAGRQGKPVLLKRGLAATIEEFILAAEYILSEGNCQVILCERGIRSFDPHTRNVLDLGAVVALKQLTHLPVIVDPSHAAGKRELVADLSRAAVAAGADGIMIECHPDPDRSVSDARQTLSLEETVELVESLLPIASAVGRKIASTARITPLRLVAGAKVNSLPGSWRVSSGAARR
jgi:3-deoxy-7-phosphoheptulonate synthase